MPLIIFELCLVIIHNRFFFYDMHIDFETLKFHGWMKRFASNSYAIRYYVNKTI